MTVCSIEGCTTRVHSRGWCITHYRLYSRGLDYELDRVRRADAVYRAKRKTDPAYLKRRAEIQRAWRNRNKDKGRAHQIVHGAIARGALVRPEFCSKCGTPGRIEASHHDYTKPLEITWLCRRCHGKVDRKRKALV